MQLTLTQPISELLDGDAYTFQLTDINGDGKID